MKTVPKTSAAQQDAAPKAKKGVNDSVVSTSHKPKKKNKDQVKRPAISDGVGILHGKLNVSTMTAALIELKRRTGKNKGAKALYWKLVATKEDPPRGN